ncbi:hypothetical protein CDL15_Pgr022205 [Punica granatum]|uniref:Uncharacterized protein n=1 Tax=Punica granatum TaxID=22663 RepID=A0A218Y2W4_PUNGR|nr:hypothetical protein CDL15_Pgr022205 [Punica granatum]PKI57708.1 hypothetical protein CRG98_021898 [Punica granatum]
MTLFLDYGRRRAQTPLVTWVGGGGGRGRVVGIKERGGEERACKPETQLRSGAGLEVEVKADDVVGSGEAWAEVNRVGRHCDRAQRKDPDVGGSLESESE